MLQKLKNLPSSPGIYQFFDESGKLLYVGKAKVLKNRVKSYFRFSPELVPSPELGPRIYKMVSEAKSLEYIVLNSESDALILENSLIKQLKPKYNILLRDDKTYPYIFVDLKEEFPRFEITRRVIKSSKEQEIKYFGPYVSGARELLDALYENYPLVQKSSCLKGKKACLFYQIGRCPAPCEFKIERSGYLQTVNEASASINAPKELLQKLTEKMYSLSEELRFEEAGEIKRKIEAISNLAKSSTVDLAKNENFDLIAAAKEANTACIVRFFIRDGKLISSSHDFIKLDDGFDNEDFDEIYEAAIVEFYAKEHPFVVQNVYTLIEPQNKEAIEEMLKEKFNLKIKIQTPKKTEIKNIASLAHKNAFELLRIKGERREDEILFQIKELFELESIPYRIETFDNSHNAGTSPVAGMVVWEERFKKEEYRHYNLESTTEYEQMREALTRRAMKFGENPPPSLWLLDGGKAVLNLADEILQSCGANVEILAIAKEKIESKAHRAKGKAFDTVYTKTKTLKLPASDKRLQFLQNLRDEAHRFAITFHRKQKTKKDKQIELMKLKGIKEGKIKKLLDYFGSFEAIQNASLPELSNAIGAKDGSAVYQFYRGADE